MRTGFDYLELLKTFLMVLLLQELPEPPKPTLNTITAAAAAAAASGAGLGERVASGGSISGVAGKTSSVKRWRASFSPEGSLDIGKCLNQICRGGIHTSISGEVWEFLLGCYDPKSAFDEREQIRQRRRDQYARLKESCSHMFPVVGSGKFITARVITANGDLIQDPTVLPNTTEGDGNDDPFIDSE